ncbi:MAG: 16S rRNA (guanine(966)-N(2))-methyltransferase RsmD [Victivallales bacterium]|nr:16S rRNA (guanine(966)-N(2))-methyltransferase RsmD [Victivallales bacterium]
MRIVSGDARGIRLTVPEEGEDIRPTEDRVKESLFSTLGDFTDTAVLDLFSGTGALGLEALSRGAARVTMVERDARHAEVIRRNLAAVRQAIQARGRLPGEALLLVAEVARVPEQLPSVKFDFILADPPYHPADGEYGGRELLLDERWMNFCGDRTLLALEHSTDTLDLPWSPRSPWRLLRKRSFGIRSVSFAKRSDNPAVMETEEFV